ncbi:DUF732 domain-containing protein [Mycobacterium novum]
MNLIKALAAAMLVAFIGSGSLVATAPPAVGDSVAYLLNVSIHPGYNFANADSALAYGQGICGKIAQGDGYAQLVRDINADFNTSDEFRASYLISQAAQELCPHLIWQLRNSAAGYRPPAT